MKSWQLISIACLVALYLGLKTQKAEEVDPTTQAVAGVCSALSELELSEVWQYDSIRRRALNQLRTEYPEGSFTPPSWMIADLKTLSESSPVSDVRLAYENISERLYSGQKTEHFIRGRQAVFDDGEDEPDGDTCPDCDGTGKVGDGRVFTECLNCGGDGKLDTNRKGESSNCDSNQRKEGDPASRQAGSVMPGTNRNGNSNRGTFPILRRLFGR